MAKTITATTDVAAYAELACVYERGFLAGDFEQRMTFKTGEDFPLEFLVKHLAAQDLKVEEYWSEKGRSLLAEVSHVVPVTHVLLRLGGLVLQPNSSS